MNNSVPGFATPAREIYRRKEQGDYPREYHWDALRAFLMVLGIPYHILLAYRTGQDWIVRSGEGMIGAEYITDFIHIFRMPAFFIVAGYFAALLLMRKDAGGWLQGRFMRLAVPLLATLLLLNPLMNYMCELSNFPPPLAWASFLHNSATSGGYWVRHLWFLIILLYFSAAIAFAHIGRPALAQMKMSTSADRVLARYFTGFWLGLAALIGLWQASAIELFYIANLDSNIPQEILRLDETIQYLPYFLLGCVLARTMLVRERLYGFSWIILLCGLFLSALYIVFRQDMIAFLPAPIGSMSVRFLSAVAAITLAQSMFALARRFMNRPDERVKRLVAASFTIYLFHMPVATALVVAGQSLMIPTGPKVALMIALTFLLSYGIWLVVERSRGLTLLFDGRWKKKEPKGHAAPVRRPVRV